MPVADGGTGVTAGSSPPRARRDGRVLLLAGVAGGLLLLVLGWVVDRWATPGVDRWLAGSGGGAGSTVRSVADTVSSAGGLPWWWLACTILLVGSLRKRQWWTAAAAAVVALVAGYGRTALAEWIARPRPPSAGPDAYLNSFPSGHAAQVTTAAVVLSVWAWYHLRAAAPAIVIGSAVCAMVVGVSRVVTGQHWATDVAGGWLFGAAAPMLLLGAGIWADAARNDNLEPSAPFPSA
jgi:undecaprenyl-diphosphatase